MEDSSLNHGLGCHYVRNILSGMAHSNRKIVNCVVCLAVIIVRKCAISSRPDRAFSTSGYAAVRTSGSGYQCLTLFALMHEPPER